MISDGKYAEFECALSNDKHFVKEPIALPQCGHCVCKLCLLNLNSNVIKCKKCSNLNEFKDLDNLKETNSIKKAIKTNFDNLIKVIEVQTIKSLEKLKSSIKTGKEIDISIDYVIHEIGVKIDSLKIEIEKIGDKFRNELNLLRKEIINHEKTLKAETENQIKSYEVKLTQLQDEIQKKLNSNDAKLYEYQTNLQAINKLIEKLNNSDANIYLEFSNEIITEKFICDLNYLKRYEKCIKYINDDEIRRRIKSCKIQVVDLNIQSTDMCILPNGYLLSANYNQANLTLFDRHLKLVKKVEKIGDKPFYPMRLATDGDTKIYVTDSFCHMLIMTDMDFNKLKALGGGGQGAGINQFNNPNGLCFYKEHLYVCDTDNKRLIKYSPSLELVSCTSFDFKPHQIKISNRNIACIRSNDPVSIYFYDIHPFKLLVKYDGHNGRISEINSFFYECDYMNSKIYCYQDTLLIEEIDTSKFNCDLKKSIDGNLLYFNGDLIISCYNFNKFIKC